MGAVCVGRGGLVEEVHGGLVEEVHGGLVEAVHGALVEEGLADEEAVVRAAAVHGVLEEVDGVVDHGVEDDASSLNFLL